MYKCYSVALRLVRRYFYLVNFSLLLSKWQIQQILRTIPINQCSPYFSLQLCSTSYLFLSVSEEVPTIIISFYFVQNLAFSSPSICRFSFLFLCTVCARQYCHFIPSPKWLILPCFTTVYSTEVPFLARGFHTPLVRAYSTFCAHFATPSPIVLSIRQKSIYLRPAVYIISLLVRHAAAPPVDLSPVWLK